MAAPLGPDRRPSPAQLHEALQAGMTKIEIADLFEVSRSTVHNWCKSRWYRTFVDELARAAWLELKSKAADDLELVRETMREVMTDTRVDNYGRPVSSSASRVQAAASLASIHERLGGLEGAPEDEVGAAGQHALEVIRAAKAARDAAVRPSEAPIPVERNV